MDGGKEVVGGVFDRFEPDSTASASNTVAAGIVESGARLAAQLTPRSLRSKRNPETEPEPKPRQKLPSAPPALKSYTPGNAQERAPAQGSQGETLSAVNAESFPLRPTTPTGSPVHAIGSPCSVDSASSSVLSSTYTPSTSNIDFASRPSTPNSPQLAANSDGIDAKQHQLPPVEFEREGPDDHGVLHLKPTEEEWRDFPSILKLARALGAAEDGCFKVTLPHGSYDALPDRHGRKMKGQAYRIKQVKRNSFWQVLATPAQGLFDPAKLNMDRGAGKEVSVHEAIGKLKKMFNKNNGRRLRHVLYRVDVPAWTAEQRQEAGVPTRSPIHPLQGDKLEKTRAVVPGIHTPYVYESAAPFGATFQLHAEDYRLISLNHLYKGRKIWIVVPSTEINTAEAAWNRKSKCSQFMRHRAEFFFPAKLEQLGIPYRIVDQRPGETVVVLPDAYHEGFSTGYTLAEAKNYADPDWSTDTYQACDQDCMLLTAIPASHMALLQDGEERLDLCANYGNLFENTDEIADEEKAAKQEQDPIDEGEVAKQEQDPIDDREMAKYEQNPIDEGEMAKCEQDPIDEGEMAKQEQDPIDEGEMAKQEQDSARDPSYITELPTAFMNDAENLQPEESAKRPCADSAAESPGGPDSKRCKVC